MDSVAPSAAPSDTVTPSPETSPDDPYTVVDEEPNLIEGELSISVMQSASLFWGNYMILLEKMFPNVVFTTHYYDDSYEYATATAAEFMAGRGDDLVYITSLPYQNYARQGMFVDLNEFLDKEPELRDDFFASLLDAYTIDGGLYALPHAFAFSSYLAEEKYYDELIEVNQDGVMMAYNDVITNFETIRATYPELLYPTNYFSASSIFSVERHRFYNYLDKYVNFGEHFLDMIQALEPYKTDSPEPKKLSESLFSNYVSIGDSMYLRQFLLDGKARAYISIGSDDTLLVQQSAFEFAMNANSPSKELAWEVMKYLGCATAMSNSGDNLGFPARRSALTPKAAIFNPPGSESYDKVLALLERLTAEIDGYTLYDELMNIAISEIFDDYENGLITAEELAARLQDYFVNLRRVLVQNIENVFNMRG